jgi:hypothetical protein
MRMSRLQRWGAADCKPGDAVGKLATIRAVERAGSALRGGVGKKL